MHIQLDIFPQQQEFYNPQFVSIFFYLSTPKSTSIKGLGSCLWVLKYVSWIHASRGFVSN